ncbi:hypothetical protein JXA32_07430 [Candidatus Sumerlaeota bacterium]|nr:hypothetical protein [Candidatus Sumerlaeota bacterium]
MQRAIGRSWDDADILTYPGNILISLPFKLLFLDLFIQPPLTGSCYYYRGEGRVYVRQGWFWFSRGHRVYRVVGDRREDGYL